MEDGHSNESMPAMPAPPPLPVLPIDDPQTLAYGRRGGHLAPPPLWLRLCAHGSWVLTIVACNTATVAFSSGSLGLNSRVILPWAIRGAIVVAMAMGVIALVWNRTYRRLGILASAVIGLVINSLVVIGVVAFALLSRQQLAAINANHQSLILAVSSLQHYNQSITKDDHWLGDGALHGANIKFRGFPDGSPLAKDLAANFTRRMSFAIIYVDSSASAQRTTIDSADIALHYSDGSSVKALNPNSILATSQRDRFAWLSSFRSPIVFAAGAKSPRWAPVFFPGGTDFTHVTSVVIPMDDQPLTLPGHFYTAAELSTPLAKPRWTGRTSWQGTQISAAARKASELAANDPYRRSFRGDVWVVSISADATAVDHADSLDTSAMTATTNDKRIINPLALDSVLDPSQPGAADVKAHVVTPLVVQARTRAGRSLIVIFPPDTDFEQVSFLTVQLNGVELLVRRPTTNRATNSGLSDTLSQRRTQQGTPTSSIHNQPTPLPGSNFSFTDPPPGK